MLVFEEPQGEPQALFTDDRKLSQILRNFISNALKFTRKGEVRVVGGAERRRHDHLLGGRHRHRHRRRNSTNAIFQDFAQIESPIQKRLRGTGLGLSLSKRLAELLGGSVGLPERAGQGLDVLGHLAVPVAGGAAATGGSPQHDGLSRWNASTSARSTASQHEVLVVDDNPASRYATVRLLRAAGFRAREAASGGEALAMADEGVSAVVLDVHLPDIDGFELSPRPALAAADGARCRCCTCRRPSSPTRTRCAAWTPAPMPT